MLHAGTLIAVFAVLWRDIWEILRKIIQPLTLFLIIATIAAVIAALTLGDVIEHAFESGKYLGVCFLVTTALLVFAEVTSKRAISDQGLKKVQDMKWYDALFIGLLQAIAIAPGISRSGATIAGALFRRLDRDFAARFSFLLSIPAILGAIVLQTKDLVTGGTTEDTVSISAAAIIAGTTCAAIVGFFSVKLMLKIIKERSLYGFAIYTAILGILILIDQFGTHFVF
jgi:undecaprenyl-diphosphatase